MAKTQRIDLNSERSNRMESFNISFWDFNRPPLSWSDRKREKFSEVWWFCLKCKGVLGVFVNQMKEIEVTKITLIVNWPGLRWLFCQTELSITGSGFCLWCGIRWMQYTWYKLWSGVFLLVMPQLSTCSCKNNYVLLRCAHFSVVSHEAIVVLAFPNFLQLYYFFLGQWYSNQLWDYLLDNI